MTRAVRFWPLGLTVLLVSIGAAIVRARHPVPNSDTRLASVSQLRAYVPKELLVDVPEDKAGEARFMDLIKLSKRLDQHDVLLLMDNWSSLAYFHEGHKPKKMVTDAEQLAIVNRIWKANPTLVSDLSAILRSGPFAMPAGEPDSYVFPVNLMRAIAFSADSYFWNRQFKLGAEMAAVAYRLGDRLVAAKGGVTAWMANSILAGIATATTDEFSKADFPADCCAAILAAAEPAAKSDETLARAIQTDFVRDKLPDLAQDKPKLTGAGTYDAIETTKLAAHGALVAMANVRGPFGKADESYFDRLLQDANVVVMQISGDDYRGPYKSLDLCTACGELLDQVNPAKPPSPETPTIKLRLNGVHNSLGRMELGMLFYDSLPLESCNQRATRDLTRILLASRIYRASHGGKLPDSTAGFVPILGAWPTNPYDGKPFTYLPTQEKVYGVGQDLIDHGGDVGAGIQKGKDAGISLKLKD